MKHRTPGILLTALTVLGTLSAAVHDSTALPSRAATASGTRDAAGTSAPAPAPVAVINGNFSEPAFTADTDTSQVRGWTIRYPYRFSGTLSGHPTGPRPFSCATAPPTTTPSASGCAAYERAPMSPSPSTTASEEHPATAPLNSSPRASPSPCRGRRHAPGVPHRPQRPGLASRPYVHLPGLSPRALLTFASTRSTGSWNCGPLIARVRATDLPPPVDKSVLKERLPEPVAYIGNDAASPKTVADQCATGAQACVFRPDTEYSYRYYDLARTVGETYINCTRNTVQQDRPVAYGDQTLDSLSQRASIDRLTNPRTTCASSSPAAPPGAGRPPRNARSPKPSNPARRPGSRPRPRASAPKAGSSAPQTTPTGSTACTSPSTALLSLPDRIYQRTGPMTTAEKQRCRADRPSDTTPNGADTPAGSNNRGT